MLKFYTGGEQDIEDNYLAVNLSSAEDAVSPEYVMEAIIDSLLGMSSFLYDNKDIYNGILADFSVDLPEGHDPKNYTNVPEILKNMEHQKLVEFYNNYCGPDCFESADEDSDTVWYSFIIPVPEKEVNDSEIWKYYDENVL